MKAIESTASRAIAWPFWIYLVAITAAELLTVYLYPLAGVISYSLILTAFIVQSVFIADAGEKKPGVGAEPGAPGTYHEPGFAAGTALAGLQVSHNLCAFVSGCHRCNAGDRP